MAERLTNLIELGQLYMCLDNFQTFYLGLEDSDPNFFQVLEYIRDLLVNNQISEAVARFLYYDFYGYLINLSPVNGFFLPFCDQIISITANFLAIDDLRAHFANNSIFVYMQHFFSGVVPHEAIEAGMAYSEDNDVEIPRGGWNIQDLTDIVQPRHANELRNGGPIVENNRQYNLVMYYLRAFQSFIPMEIMDALDTFDLYTWRRIILVVAGITSGAILYNAILLGPHFIFNSYVVTSLLVQWSA